MTRHAYAAQSVVTAGLRAHTRETASPFPWGAGGLPEVDPDLLSAPNACPWGVRTACKAGVRARCAGQRTRGGDEEESCHHDA